MVIAAHSDLLYGIVGYLRSFSSEWHTLGLDSAAGWKQPLTRSGLRISSEIQGGDLGWKMPTRAIVLRKAGGPTVGDDYALGIKTTRIDTFSYGATGQEADGVWALLDAILVPQTGLRVAGFTRSGVTVVNVVPESDASALRDPDTDWRYVFASYAVKWMSGS